MYKQGDMIRDFIFPIISFEILENGSVGYKQFFGTGFFLGNRGFALTAAHVANKFRNEKMAAMFVDVDLSWKLFSILDYELHPSEDIALLKIEGKNWQSIFTLSTEWVGQTCRYETFGYPSDVLQDVSESGRESSTQRPDLVYTQGYIRRRLSNRLPGQTGTNFF